MKQINFLGFAQRKFIGFRNRYEFEKRRLVMASKHSYSIIGFDHRKHVYELLRGSVDDPEKQEILFIDFLEDSSPQYILILTANKQTGKTSL